MNRVLKERILDRHQTVNLRATFLLVQATQAMLP